MRFTSSLMVLVLVLAATACSHAPRASEIVKLAVTQTICDPHCRSWGATLYPGDGADISGATPEDEIHTSVFHGTFATSTKWLTQTAFFSGKSDYRHDPDPENTTYVTAWTGKFERQVAIPSRDPEAASDRSLSVLTRFASFESASVWAARNRARAVIKKRLANVAAISLVEYDANGCFGSCPNYKVRFIPDGRASIDSIDPYTRAHVNARATVPFAAIVRILKMSQFTDLQTRYLFRTHDVFGASLHLRYRGGFTFDSEAPDRTQWSDEFEQIATRIDQVVLDTRWTPPLPPRNINDAQQ